MDTEHFETFKILLDGWTYKIKQGYQELPPSVDELIDTMEKLIQDAELISDPAEYVETGGLCPLCRMLSCQHNDYVQKVKDSYWEESWLNGHYD